LLRILEKTLTALRSDVSYPFASVHESAIALVERELTATTRDFHQLVGRRKWRFMVMRDGSGTPTFVLETVADERTLGLNQTADRVRLGRKEQVSIWKGYLERTADAIIGKFGGTRTEVGFSIQKSPTPRPNKYKS
jgi:hypothetical protein